ncbi:MAG: S8 family serine peptidase, partial [Verrucomicrobiales bacterium]|nr:S8 family serine peptidase [Verrucomicrobiales bacterium]
MLSLRGCRARTAVLLAAWFGLSLAASAAGAEPIRGEVLVKTRWVPGAGPQLMGGLRLPAGARVERVVGTRGWRLVRLAADQPLEEALRWFRGQEGVLAVEPNHRYQLHTAAESAAARLPDDPQLTRLYGLASIGAPEVWGRTVGSTNVVVAILDTGVDVTHPDLAANIWRNRREIPGNGRDDDANGWIDDDRGVDVVEGDGDPNDEAGHGTHVAGTIGAVGNNALGVSGVCWNVSLLPVRVGKADGFGTTDQLVAAFDYVVALRERGENVRVINCSWGGGFPSFALNEAVAAAGAAGVLVVCSAGNDRQDNDLLPVYPACFDVPQILSVASSTSCDDASSFSNFGRTTVDLAAPGSGILSTFRGGARYAVLSGTSMASPHVAGAAALLLAHRPNLTVDALRTLILSSVDVLPAWAGRVVSGGRLNLARALAAADTVPAPATPAAPAAPVSRLESISRHPTRSWGNDTSSGGVVSADGRWVAFDSFATNLVTGDREGYRDVFLVDRVEHTLVRISQTTAGVGGRGDSYNPVISADGRVVVFVSEAQDLTVGDANGAPDIYVWDRETRRLELVSVRQDGRGAGNAESDSPALSADGTQVAFASEASDLVPSDSNKTRDVFVRNRTTRLTERVSVSSGGVQGNAYSDAPSMSADGSVVAFHSYAYNLVTRDRNATWDVFVRDRRLGTTERVSAPEGGILESDDRSEYPILSADGRYVVFMSYADLLDGGEPDEFLAVMVVDRQTRSVRRVDRRPGVTTSAGDGYPESISAEGRFVFFSSDDVQLAPGGAPGLFRVFVHDQSTGATGPLDVSEGGYGPEDNSFQARCSPDGRYVAFTSFAYNLVPGDGNSTADVFLLDRGETRADLSVRRSGSGAESWVGEGFVHAMVPQRASTLVAAGGVAAFEVKVSNAGPEAAFLLRGEGPVTGVGAGVKVVWGRTGADITDSVLGAGWRTGVIPAGAHEVIRVEMIQPSATSLEPRRDFRLGASSISGGAALDAVELVVAAPETAPSLALASRAANGSPASRNAEVAGLSRDGRFVVFSTDSEAMEARPDTNFMADVFLWAR